MLKNDIIQLRAPEPEDLDVLYAWENDPDNWIYGNTLTPFSRYILKKFIENAHLDIFEAKQARLMIDITENPETYTPVGAIDLFDFDPQNQRAGVGIIIGDKIRRNKGIAGNALELLIEYSFQILKLKQLYCNISEDNLASIRLFQSKGFVVTGKKKDWIKTNNGFKDELFLQLINKHISVDK